MNPASSVRSARVLVIHDSYPLIDRSGADSRLFKILTALSEDGHAVTYLARSTDGRIPYAANLTQLGIEVVAGDAECLRWSGQDLPVEWNFETVLREGNFDLAILFHWFWSGVSVAEDYLDDIQRLSPRTLTAVLTDDFHGLRERRAAELSGKPADWERAFNFEAREFEVYRRADLVLAISASDRDAFLAIDPLLKIEILPMAASTSAPGPEFANRDGLLFVAHFANPASRDGVTGFLTEVWPQVKRGLPEISLRLVGNQAPSELATPGSGIECLGHSPNLDPVFEGCRVFVSPIRFGTGIKTKNLLALAHGLPLVTTTVGAEGLNLLDAKNALIADLPRDFARAILRAHTDSSLWKKLSANGIEHAQMEFSIEQLRAKVRDLIHGALNFQPNRATDSSTPSFRRVEKEFPEVLTHQPPEARIQFRIERHLALAEHLMAKGDARAARAQLRHIFALTKSPVPQSPLFSRIFALLDRCYRKLGESKPYRG